MNQIRAQDLAYVRFGAPALDEMRRFLLDFGLADAGADDDRLFMRGVGPSPFLHWTERGEAGFRAVGVRLEAISDLERLALREGAEVVPLEAPGGGFVARMRDPDGFLVEAVAGQNAAPAGEIDMPPPWNNALARSRLRAVRRISPGPARVLRLGHCVLNVSNFRASERWWKDRFGFITSDEVAVSPEFALGAFMRCDRGDEPSDHHTLFLAQGPRGPGFNHAAFEVLDLDDLMRGHSHLANASRTPAWGVGRHILGSQVFDYWRDPHGHTLEHFTDGDLFTAADPPGRATVQDLLGVQWGPSMPPNFG